MSGPLANPRHELFAQEVAKGATAGDAYVTAGYEPDDGHASRLAGNGKVRNRIRELQGKAAQRAGVTIERVLKAYAEIAFADMGTYADWDGTGVSLKESAGLTKAQRRVVAEVSETRTEGPESSSCNVRFKLHPKLPALDALAKYLGMSVNKHELTGKDGGPIATGSWLDIAKAAHKESQSEDETDE